MSIVSNLSRSGQNNGSGDKRELFIKKTQTDVLAYFRSKNIFEGLVTVQSISEGKSKAFPIVGKSKAEYHEAGTELEGNKIKSTERIITIDKMLVAHTYVPQIDELMVHYDAKSAYNQELGRALAEKYDEDIARMLVIAGKLSNAGEATLQGLKDFDDDVYTEAQYLDDQDVKGRGHAIFQLVKRAKVEWRKKKVMGEPCIVFASEYYYDILDNPQNAGATWISDPLRQGDQVPAILGCPIYESPNMPQEDDSSNSEVHEKYRADFRGTVGVMFSKEAIGVLKMLDLQVESNYIPQRIADLMTAKLLVGLGILNHACAIAFLSEELAQTVKIENQVFSGDTAKEFNEDNDIELAVTFSENVIASANSLTITLFNNTVGKQNTVLTLDSGSGSKTLVFKGTVASDAQDAAAGKLIVASSIELNAATLKTVQGVDVSTKLQPMDVSDFSISYNS